MPTRFSVVSTAIAAGLLAACSSASSGISNAHGEADDAGGSMPLTFADAGDASTTDAHAAKPSDANDASTTKAEATAKGPLAAATSDTWTWIPIPESHCGDGSATGIGVNPHPGATQLLIYLQGGGACEDADSCWGAEATASNMTGYTGTDFATDPTLQAVIFQRALAGNPFNDATLVFVPYCTGDLHIGNTTASFDVGGTTTPTYFHGAANLDTFTATLAAEYTGLSRIFLTGVSAGGFGSFLNQDAVAHAFGDVRVDVIDDSGPAVTGTPVPTVWSPRLPAACSSCVDAPSTFQYMRTTYPKSRYGFLTFQTDTVLPLFFGETDAAFATQIQQFVTSLGGDPGTNAFVDTSSGHVVLEETDPVAAPFILPWLTQLATDDATWATVQH